MAWTLLDIQNQIASEIDQSASAPTAGGADWNLRLNFINRSLRDWAETYEWSALHKIHNGLVTASGFATYSLPTDFRKLDGFPRITWDGRTAADFPVVDPTYNSHYTDSDKYVNVLGNDRDRKSLFIHAPQTLVSGASVQFTYWATPVSLATSTDTTECPDPSYLVQRTLYYLHKSNEDGRFPEAKQESDRILARMLESENAVGRGYESSRIPNWNETRYSFRIGRD